MYYCVTGVIGSVIVGKLLDKYKCYKLMINLLAMTLVVCLTLTYVAVHYLAEYPLVEQIIIIFTGAPMFSVSVPTFQFVAEVIYPVSEIQGISLVNVINKLISFGTVKLGTYLNKMSTEYIFFVWISLALLGLIPGLLVKEDLRRLNMKDVDKSEYFEDIALMNIPRERRKAQFIKHKIIADKNVIEELELDYSDIYNIEDPNRSSYQD